MEEGAEGAVLAEDVVGDEDAAIFITTAKAIVNVKIADVPPEAAIVKLITAVAIGIITTMACHLC